MHVSKAAASLGDQGAYFARCTAEPWGQENTLKLLCCLQGNLLKHISRIGSLSEAHIVQNVMQPLLQALQHLHAQVSHRTSCPASLCIRAASATAVDCAAQSGTEAGSALRADMSASWVVPVAYIASAIRPVTADGVSQTVRMHARHPAQRPQLVNLVLAGTTQ